jgi:hypothetical protein
MSLALARSESAGQNSSRNYWEKEEPANTSIAEQTGQVVFMLRQVTDIGQPGMHGSVI